MRTNYLLLVVWLLLPTLSLAQTKTLPSGDGSAAATAVALATNGANCSAGQAPLGVSAAGAAESCFAVPTVIASGTEALTTTIIATTACDVTDDDIVATGALSTDTLVWVFNADISAVTGYNPVTTGALIVYAWPGTDEVNFKVCNPTALSITPGAVTVNWKVLR